tara:strand:- start:2042 stop:2311 length:270 start_codon:yes stop_codon:yes gene_type:complete
MDNQHQKIKGYRDLSQQEIDLMNEIKEHGEKTKALLGKVGYLRLNEQECKTVLSPEKLSESFYCLRIAKENLQQGQMWFVRAVALPDSF